MEAADRILVVDDMPAIRMLVKNMLLGMGYKHIDESDDGGMAWSMIQNASMGDQPYKLIIADWNMPAMSGVELLRAVRGFRKTRKLPFVIITAQGSSEHLQEAFDAEVSDYIVKPFTSEQLQTKISGVMSAVL